MKKVKLSLVDSQQFNAIGVVCAEKDYRLSFYMNRDMNFNLIMVNDSLLYTGLSDAAVPVSCHFYEEEDTGRQYYLVKNRQESFILAPQYRMADFILLINPETQEDVIDGLRKQVGSIPQVQSTFVIPNDQLKYIKIDAE